MSISTEPTANGDELRSSDSAEMGVNELAGENATESTITTLPETKNVAGRAVFAVETIAAGVAVRTAFLTEENKLLNMPAVFPDLVYAMNVIDDLKSQVLQHFSQAARVGAQVIASQMQQQLKTPSEDEEVTGQVSALVAAPDKVTH